jgi:hypothetical protein
MEYYCGHLFLTKTFSILIFFVFSAIFLYFISPLLQIPLRWWMLELKPGLLQSSHSELLATRLHFTLTIQGTVAFDLGNHAEL